MDWIAPTFVEIKMDAEIGSYQEDGEPVPFEGIAEHEERPAARPVGGSAAAWSTPG